MNDVSRKETTFLRQCVCTHSYQDGVYGRGMRVHNISSAKNGRGADKRREYRCTVCGKRTPA